MKKTFVFELISENLTNLGGPMGMEDTSTNWTKLFHSVMDAKAFAQRDYERAEIKWTVKGNTYSSGDLGYVMYTITRKEVN